MFQFVIARVTDKSVRKFLAVGILSFALDYGVLLILHSVVGVQLNIATTLAFLAGLGVNFMLNKLWTFNAARGPRQSTLQALRYGVLVVVNIFLTNAIITSAYWMSVGPEISKPLATAGIMVLNYVVYQRIIFRPESPSGA